MERRLARHAVVSLSGRGQGNQARRAADRPRIADRAIHLSRPVRRYLRAGQVCADHRQHPGAERSEGMEVRVRIAVQGRRLLCGHAAFHRQQMGHGQSGDDARPGFRHRAPACVRHLRFPHHRSEAVSEGSRRHRRPFSSRRVQRHDALAHRQRLLRGAGAVENSCARRRGALRASSATRCCR